MHPILVICSMSEYVYCSAVQWWWWWWWWYSPLIKLKTLTSAPLPGVGSCSQGRPCAGAGNYHTGMCHKMIVNPDTASALLSSPQSAIICTLGVMGHCQYRASLSLRLCDNETLGQFNTYRPLISRQLQWSNLRCPFIGKFNWWSENDGQLDMQENGKGFFDILVFGWSCLI